jgi:hypothetical protein
VLTGLALIADDKSIFQTVGGYCSRIGNIATLITCIVGGVIGKATELSAPLEYAEKHVQPTWDIGGVYYPRNDLATDEEGHWRHMDPIPGNSAIGYARFNVKTGRNHRAHAVDERDSG